MNQRPRVTAHHRIDAISDQAMCSPLAHTTPGVIVDVDFDLHDHVTALSLLEQAVAKVRAQIEETAPECHCGPNGGVAWPGTDHKDECWRSILNEPKLRPLELGPTWQQFSEHLRHEGWRIEPAHNDSSHNVWFRMWHGQIFDRYDAFCRSCQVVVKMGYKPVAPE